MVSRRSVNYVTPPYGLGNRIISMGSVLSLATELNYRPRMFWTPDETIGGASFGDLFESTSSPFELVEGYEARIIRPILYGYSLNPFKKMVLRLLRSLGLLYYGKKIELPDTKSHIEFRDRVATDLLPSRKIVLSAFDLIRYRYDISWLKPVPPIARRITELKQQFTPDTVGIHFRGTDGPFVPPAEKMIARMRAEIALNPNVKFFLASDGDKQGQVLETLFKDRLIKFKKSDIRWTTQGQQDAVVDLFGLAATSRIIGFKYSSFVIAAALIGNKPLLGINPTKRKR